MVRSAWIRDNKTITRVDLNVDVEVDCKSRSDLWKIHDKFIYEFMHKYPCTIILEISRIGLCDELDMRSGVLKRDFRQEAGETLQHARMRYAFMWCNSMKGVWFPNVRAYSDTEYDPDTSVACNAISACILQMLREDKQLDILDDISKFERYYNESLHEQLLEVQR